MRVARKNADCKGRRRFGIKSLLKKIPKLTGFFKRANEEEKSTSTSGNGAAIASGDAGDGAPLTSGDYGAETPNFGFLNRFHSIFPRSDLRSAAMNLQKKYQSDSEEDFVEEAVQFGGTPSHAA